VIQGLVEEQATLAIKQTGRTTDEYGIVLMESGKYLGYGFVPRDIQFTAFEELKAYIRPYQDNQDVRRIIENYTHTADQSAVLCF